MKEATVSALGFAPITPQRAFEEIAAQIRELVASGKLKPGDRLPAERGLSAKFNVSRNTLREALRALELSGMIELRKGATGGAFVLPGSSGVIVNGLRDLYHLGAITPEQLTEARIWLSAIVVRVACERLTEDDLEALEANIEAATRAQKAGNFDERARLHREFHTLLATATRNPDHPDHDGRDDGSDGPVHQGHRPEREPLHPALAAPPDDASEGPRRRRRGARDDQVPAAAGSQVPGPVERAPEEVSSASGESCLRSTFAPA